MHSTRLLPLVLTALPLLVTAATARDQDQDSGRTYGEVKDPYQLGNDTHLFLDDYAIRDMNGVTFAVNPPTMRGVVIPPDRGDVDDYTSVVDDGSGVYKMYYLKKGDEWHVALATSKDGIHWDKPTLGLIEFNGSKDNNFVIQRAATGSVYYDMHDPNPNYRYKFLTNYTTDDKPGTTTTEGVVIYTSPDGLHFTKNETVLFSAEPAAPSYSAETQASIFFDPNINKYVGYLRGYIEGDGERRRSILRAETDDPMKPWPMTKVKSPYFMDPQQELPYLDRELETVFAADMDDLPNTDMYNSQVFLYPWAKRVYFAFPTWYYHYSKDRSYLRQLTLETDPDKKEETLKQWNAGIGEVQLMTSRDGKRWTRYRQTPYVKHGWYGDHYAYWPWLYQGMIRRGERILQYGMLRPRGHRIEFMEGSDKSLTGAVLFEQMADRFAGMEFEYSGGQVVTDPIVFEGNRLVLNVDVQALGEGRVGIIRADGTRLPGFDVEECDIINGDWKAKTVSWKQGFTQDVGHLAGQPVRLVFKMNHAWLYAMKFEAVPDTGEKRQYRP